MIDMKNLLIGTNDKKLWSKEFGLLTLFCIKEDMEIEVDSYPIDSNRNGGYYGYGGIQKTKLIINDLYLAKQKTNRDQYGRTQKEFSYSKFGFKMNKDDVLVVKRNNGYCRVQGAIVALISSNDYLNIRGIPNVIEWLSNNEWIESDKEILVDPQFVSMLQVGTRVYINKGSSHSKPQRYDAYGRAIKAEQDYSQAYGEGIITTLLDYDAMNQEAIFQITTFKGNRIYVKFKEKRIMIVDTKQYKEKNEIDAIQKPIHEELLNVYVRPMDKGFNVYWYEIEDAACYSLQVYTWRDNSIDKKLYKLKDITIERTQYFYSQEGLSKGTYYIVLSAENRENKKIAVAKAYAISI